MRIINNSGINSHQISVLENPIINTVQMILLQRSANRFTTVRSLLRSFSSSIPDLQQIKAHELGFVFDMDGVLLKGSKPIPKASEALHLLKTRQIPWIVLTNGGGISESKRAELLAQKLNIPVDVEQIVQSHTPLITLPNRQDQTVLVIGGDRDNSKKVAKNYGFGKVLITADYIKTNPSIWPFHNKELLTFGEHVEGIDDLKIDNILVFNDPRDLGTDIQVISDILRRDPNTPVIFSNNDWVWANDYKNPRFGQGVTRYLIEQLFNANHEGKVLNSSILGKPTRFAYDFAHHVLINRANVNVKSELEFGKAIESSHFKQVYMIGDNPASDIIGGYNYGWNTGLVLTGVYKLGDKLPCNPTIIGEDVYDVVSEAIKKAGLW